MKLSICIPTFNRVTQLRETLLSFVPQLTEGMEIVVSDNASTDGTNLMVAELMRQYPCISYHCWPQNMGADRNYLRVIEAAKGEYCWFFGSDDLVRPGAVNKVLDLLEYGCDIYLLNRIEWHQDKGKMIPNYMLGRGMPSKSFVFCEPDVRQEYFAAAQNLCALFSYLSSIVVRRAAWFSIPYDESYTGTAYSHAFILLSMVKAGCSLRYAPHQFVDARLGDDSFAKDGVFKRVMLDLNGYSKIRDGVFCDDTGDRRAINQVLHRQYKWWRLASIRSNMTVEEWRIVGDCLGRTGYPKWLLLCAGLLGNAHSLLRVLKRAKWFWISCQSS